MSETTELGLALSTRPSHLMEGTLWLETEGAHGSTSPVTLIAEAVPGEPSVYLRGRQPHVANSALLIVEASATNQRVLAEYARSWGMLPRATASAGEALDWLRRGDGFDVAIVAARLPDRDGLTLAAEIRQHRDAAMLPVVLVGSSRVGDEVAALRGLGYRADVAANGLEGPRALERQAYDVVLMDLQMPELDGLATSREICGRWPRERRPRIVATTATDSPEIREARRAAGIDDFVGKADRVEAWVAMLQRCSSRAVWRGPS